MRKKAKSKRKGVSEDGVEFTAAPGQAAGTVVSTKGQVILPKAIRDRKGWGPGTKLVVEETAQGVVLRSQKPFPPTRLEDVVGSLKYDGPPKTIEEMNAAVLEEAAERHRRIK